MPVSVLTDVEMLNTQSGFVYEYTQAKFNDLQHMMQLSDQKTFSRPLSKTATEL